MIELMTSLKKNSSPHDTYHIFIDTALTEVGKCCSSFATTSHGPQAMFISYWFRKRWKAD